MVTCQSTVEKRSLLELIRELGNDPLTEHTAICNIS